MPAKTCALCGRAVRPEVDGDPPLGWCADHGPDDDPDAVRYICPECTRRHVREIEAKLGHEWW